MPSRRVVVLGRLAIVLVPVLFFGSLEALSRALGLEARLSAELAIPQWIDRDQLARKLPLEKMAGRSDDLRAFYSAYRPDRFLFYRLKPDLRIPMVDILVETWREELGWTLDTNAHGYRGAWPPKERRPGVFRVACLGDSSTYGWGLEMAESYAACLERQLARRHGPGRFEVMNFGVPGYTSFQGSVLLERDVMDYRPDLVTIAYGANDDSVVTVTSRQRYERAVSWVGLAQYNLGRSHAYGALKALVAKARGIDVAARFRAARERTTSGTVDVSEEEYLGIVGSMVDRLRSGGVDVVIVAQCLSRKPESRLHALRRLAEAKDVPLVDVFVLHGASADLLAEDEHLRGLADRYAGIYGEETLAANPRLRFLLPDMCHPNAVLAELVAHHLADAAASRCRGLRRFLGVDPP